MASASPGAIDALERAPTVLAFSPDDSNIEHEVSTPALLSSAARTRAAVLSCRMWTPSAKPKYSARTPVLAP